MSQHLYISHLHTPLAYHLGQLFRNDHLQLHPEHKIVGTSPQTLHFPWIHATINVTFCLFSSKNIHKSLAEQSLIAAQSSSTSDHTLTKRKLSLNVPLS